MPICNNEVRLIANNKGISLVELLIAMLLLATLLFITVSFYPPVMKIFSSGKDTYDLRDELSVAREMVSNYLVKASAFNIVNSGRIDFTANVDVTTTSAESCIFYLYNASDTNWPATYSYSSYELRFMTYTPGPGQPVFGSGRSICYGLNPPPNTTFSAAGSQIAVTLNKTKNMQNMILRFEIHPRNM